MAKKKKRKEEDLGPGVVIDPPLLGQNDTTTKDGDLGPDVVVDPPLLGQNDTTTKEGDLGPDVVVDPPLLGDNASGGEPIIMEDGTEIIVDPPLMGGEKFSRPINTDDSNSIKKFQASRSIADTSKSFMDNYIAENSDLIEEDPSLGQVPTQDEKQAQAQSFIQNISEIPPAIGQGLLKAAQEMGNTVIDLADWAETYGGMKSGLGSTNIIPDEERLSFANDPSLVYQPTTTTGKIVSGISEFIGPASALGKMSKGASAVTKLGKFAKAGAIGAAVDFAAFDPGEKRLSNLVQSFPALRNPVTQYLASNPKDTKAEGRLKNALEGLGIGVAIEGLTVGLKAVRHNRIYNSIMKDGEALAAKADAKGIDLNIPEGADPEAIVKHEETIASLKAEAKAERQGQLELFDEESINTTLASVMDTTESSANKILAEIDGVKVPKGMSININLDNIQAGDDVAKIIDATSKTFTSEIDEARRGIITEEQSRKMAKDLGMSFEDLANRQEGQAFNAEKVIATRMHLNSSASAVSSIAQKIKSGDTSAATKALLLQAIDRHRVVQSQAAGVAAEAGRALQAFKQNVGLDGATRARYIDDLIKSHGGNSGIDEIVEAITRNPDTASISTLTRKSTSRKITDVAKEVYINGLLSGPKTHLFNLLSNTSVIGSSIVERKVAETFAGGSIDSVAKGEAKAMFTGLMGSLQDAFKAGKNTLKTGDSLFGSKKIEFERSVSASTFGKDDGSVFGKAINFMGSIMNAPTRSLEASDEVFKMMNYRMEVYAQAHRKATREQVAKNLSEADTAKLFQDLVNNPSDDIVMGAKDFARENTFTKPTGDLRVRGFNPGSLDQAIRDSAAMRVIAPFTKTNLNLVEYSLNRTLFAKGLYSDIKAGGIRKDTALARVSLGMTAMAMTTAATVGGMVTGRGPSSPGARKALEASGWKPYSIKVGDTFVPYNRLDPISSIIAISADMSEIVGSLNSERSEEAQDLAIQAGAAMANFFTPEFLMENVNDFLDALNGDSKKLDRIVGNIGGAMVPFSSGLRFVRQEVTDPIKRDTRPDPNAAFPIMDKIMRGVRNTIPGLSDTLPPQKDIFGKVKTYNSWFAKNPDDESPLDDGEEDFVAKEIRRMNMVGPQHIDENKALDYLKIDMPERYMRKSFGGQNVTVKLTPEQYDKYVDLSAGIGLQSAPEGKTLKQFLNDEIRDDYPGLDGNKTDEAKRLYIKNIISNYRKAARQELMIENQDIEEKFIEGAEKNFSAITGEDINLSL